MEWWRLQDQDLEQNMVECFQTGQPSTHQVHAV